MAFDFMLKIMIVFFFFFNKIVKKKNGSIAVVFVLFNYIAKSVEDLCFIMHFEKCLNREVRVELVYFNHP
jgi:hypothetical protein